MACLYRRWQKNCSVSILLGVKTICFAKCDTSWGWCALWSAWVRTGFKGSASLPPHPEPRSPSLSSPGISRRLIIFLFQANRLLNASKIDGAGMPQQNAGAALQVHDLSKIAVTWHLRDFIVIWFLKKTLPLTPFEFKITTLALFCAILVYYCEKSDHICLAHQVYFSLYGLVHNISIVGNTYLHYTLVNI